MSENNKNTEWRKWYFFNKCKMIRFNAETYAKNCVYDVINKEKSCG